MSNVIEFNRFECLTAEAIFGDMIEILFAGQVIWEGPVNTNASYAIRQSRMIPQGAGAQIVINQWYFGQRKECVYISPPITRADGPGEYIHHVDPNADKDPNGEYVLYALLSSEDRRARTLKPLPPNHRKPEPKPPSDRKDR